MFNKSKEIKRFETANCCNIKSFEVELEKNRVQ